MIHKDYIKKKNNQNENEKNLFHGTLICYLNSYFKFNYIKVQMKRI
jgi:hypothetical protein